MTVSNPVEHIDYLAALDTGNASIRWPQKESTAAGRLQNQYDEQIERILKLNLMWRPSIAVRHFDLFDNLALAKFVVRNETLCRDLSLAGLFRVCSPKAASFEEILEHWALAGGAGDPMHWHHLSPEQQEDYDRASKRKQIKSAADIQKHLYLDDHGLALETLFRAYNSIYPTTRIIVVKPLVHRVPLYAERVEKKWETYLGVRRSYGFAPTPATRNIESVLEKCCNAKGRRRAFYSYLERAIDPLKFGKESGTIEAELLETKCLVLNDAFYDEFEQFQLVEVGGGERAARITAGRDVRKEWFPVELMGKPAQTPSDALLSVPFSPLDAISLGDILRLHTSEDAEAKSFQKSILNLKSIYDRSQTTKISDQEISQAIKDHLAILQTCVLRTLRAQNRANLMSDAKAKVFLGYPATAFAVAGGLSSLAFGMVAGLAGGVLGLLFTGLFTFWLEKETTTNEWLQVEAALQESIEAETKSPGAQ